MNAKVLLAIFAAAVFYFFAGWGIYGVLLHGFMESHTATFDGLVKEMPDFPMLILSQFAWAGLVVMVIHKSGQGSLKGGFITGLWVGALLMACFDASFAAFYNLMDSTALITDFVVGTFYTAAGGAIGGFVLGSGSKA